MMHNFLSWNFFRSLKAVQKWKGLDQTKLLQIGMAGPSDNLEFLKLIQEDQKENEQHQLIDIGSCGLHKIHNEFKTGAEQTDWRMKKIFKRGFQILKEWKISSQSVFQTSLP